MLRRTDTWRLRALCAASPACGHQTSRACGVVQAPHRKDTLHGHDDDSRADHDDEHHVHDLDNGDEQFEHFNYDKLNYNDHGRRRAEEDDFDHNDEHDHDFDHRAAAVYDLNLHHDDLDGGTYNDHFDPTFAADWRSLR